MQGHVDGDEVRYSRRAFHARGVALATAGLLANRFVSAQSVPADATDIDSETKSDVAAALDESNRKFTMRFAPHPGMFAAVVGNNVLDQIRFAHDHGFSAWEHNGMPSESESMQEQIGQLLSDCKMRMGVFVAYADFGSPTFSVSNAESRKSVLTSIRNAVAIAGRCNATYMTVVPGTVPQPSPGDLEQNRYGGPRIEEGYQFANVVDLLRECASLLEPHQLVMVLEPLNWKTDHGGVFLQRTDQAYAICKAVASPSCKILFDIYHQQITEGNLISNIERAWDEIAYLQAGDNPGRKEPGTGEINYQMVFRRIHERATREGRDLIVGMEHGNSVPGKEGVESLINAYRVVDPRREKTTITRGS